MTTLGRLSSASLDFKNFFKIVSLSNSKAADKGKRSIEKVRHRRDGKKVLNPPKNPDDDLKRLAEGSRAREDIHWELVSRFVEIKPETETRTGHGTRVAGIIGANKKLWLPR